MLAIPYDGFWAPMDTLKERAHLEDLYRTGREPVGALARRARRAGRRPSQLVLTATALVTRTVIPLELPDGPLRSSASAPTPTTSRSAAAARC